MLYGRMNNRLDVKLQYKQLKCKQVTVEEYQISKLVSNTRL